MPTGNGKGERSRKPDGCRICKETHLHDCYPTRSAALSVVWDGKSSQEEVSSQRPTHWTQHYQGSPLWTRLTLLGDFCLLNFTPAMRDSSRSCCSTIMPLLHPGCEGKALPTQYSNSPFFSPWKRGESFQLCVCLDFFTKGKLSSVQIPDTSDSHRFS